MTRSRRSPFLALLAVLGVFSLAAAACSDDDGDTSTDGETTTTTAAGDDGGDDGGDEAEGAAASTDGDRSDWPDTLVLAAVPAEQDAQLQESYRVTREILEDELGIEVEFFQAADYAGVVEALIASRVDLAQFGPFSYVIAVANGADAAPVGVMVEEEGGEPGYQSYLVARSDNDDINELADVEGQRVCFVDPSSTSGYLYPIAGLLAIDIDPESDVDPIFAGGHDASAISVVNGDCDAGYAFDSMVEVLLPSRGEIEEGDLKVVWESEVIAGSPMTMRNDLPESLKDAIADIFENKINVDWAFDNGYCESNDPAECSFSDEAIWGYVPRDDSFYDGVRVVCRETGAPQCDGIS
ncbi:MAG: phosphate/phosphite/phosphonate ABC transporter substrate-binding protein [Acidimicrobiia bacterium]|nr:phosphate/phosphite/phosphonate ABC transporter substrate-binding protein [Acidimicrobiia bacterium]